MNTKELRDQLDQIARLEEAWQHAGPAEKAHEAWDELAFALIEFYRSGGRELAEDGMRIHWVCENDKMKIDEWRKTIDAARAKEGKK